MKVVRRSGCDVVVVVQDAVIGRRELLFVVARVATVKAWVSWGIPRLLK
jgi:hypothetical protein